MTSLHEELGLAPPVLVKEWGWVWVVVSHKPYAVKFLRVLRRTKHGALVLEAGRDRPLWRRIRDNLFSDEFVLMNCGTEEAYPVKQPFPVTFSRAAA